MKGRRFPKEGVSQNREGEGRSELKVTKEEEARDHITKEPIIRSE